MLKVVKFRYRATKFHFSSDKNKTSRKKNHDKWKLTYTRGIWYGVYNLHSNCKIKDNDTRDLTFAPTRRPNATNTLKRNSMLSFNHKYFASVRRILMSATCPSEAPFLTGPFWIAFPAPICLAQAASLAAVEKNACPFCNKLCLHV